jgi:DHA2 family multidrug resistance protein
VTPIAGALYNRVGGRWLIAIGSILLAVNTWYFAHITIDTSYIEIMGLVAIRGVALGLVLQTTLTAALTDLNPRQLPRASSLLTATRNVFQSFGVGILGTIVTNQLAAYNTNTLNDLKNPATSLGKLFISTMQGILHALPPNLPAAVAEKAAAGKAIAQILAQQVPLNFVSAINDAYWVTFWLSIASAILAFTLPGKPRKTKEAQQESPEQNVASGIAAQP